MLSTSTPCLGELGAKLVVIRGLPGSGKSTLARRLAREFGYMHFENDMYFEGEAGYEYRPESVKSAQRWCWAEVSNGLLAGGRVVVSNVFTRVSHMKSFFALTDDHIVIRCTANYGTIHNVPKDVIAAMQCAWEPFPKELEYSNGS